MEQRKINKRREKRTNFQAIAPLHSEIVFSAVPFNNFHVHLVRAQKISNFQYVQFNRTFFSFEHLFTCAILGCNEISK